jgi:glycine cleavage system protein P-like pyridoxal-binding family
MEITLAGSYVGRHGGGTVGGEPVAVRRHLSAYPPPPSPNSDTCVLVSATRTLVVLVSLYLLLDKEVVYQLTNLPFGF